MPVTYEQVRAHLDPEEPNYAAAARELGPEALPHLQAMVNGPDPLLASKAAYLAALLNHAGVVEVLREAARSPHPTVRVAVAAAVSKRPELAGGVFLEELASDDDPGVRKIALKTLQQLAGPSPKATGEAGRGTAGVEDDEGGGEGVGGGSTEPTEGGAVSRERADAGGRADVGGRADTGGMGTGEVAGEAAAASPGSPEGMGGGQAGGARQRENQHGGGEF